MEYANEREIKCPICGTEAKSLGQDYSWNIVKCINCGEYTIGQNDEDPNLSPQEVAILQKYLYVNNRLKREGEKIQILKSKKSEVFSLINNQ